MGSYKPCYQKNTWQQAGTQVSYIGELVEIAVFEWGQNIQDTRIAKEQICSLLVYLLHKLFNKKQQIISWNHHRNHIHRTKGLTVQKIQTIHTPVWINNKSRGYLAYLEGRTTRNEIGMFLKSNISFETQLAVLYGFQYNPAVDSHLAEQELETEELPNQQQITPGVLAGVVDQKSAIGLDIHKERIVVIIQKTYS